MSGDPLVDCLWRTGRKLGRTIYAMTGPDDDREQDTLIGIMDTPELAKWVAAEHNCPRQSR